MKVNAQNQLVADDDPSGVRDATQAEIDAANAPPPPPPVDHTATLNAYSQQLLEESRERARLQRQVEELQSRQNAPAPVTPEQEKQFFDAPRTATAEIVRQELQQQVGPINQFVQQMQRDQTYATLKNQMRANPAQFQYLSQVESTMDRIVSQLPNIDGNSVVFAYQTAIGNFIQQGGNLSTQSPSPSPTPALPPNPPHVRPSAPPPPPSRNNGAPRITLNENQKKIARFNNMTDEQYIAWTEQLQPGEVAHISDDDVKARYAK